MLVGEPNHYWQLCSPLLLHASGSDFRLYDGSDLKTYLLMRWKGPDALAVCLAHRGLPVGFLLLWYSVLFTVESISLLYLVLYVLGDNALISLGSFMQTKHLCVLIYT